MRKCPAWIKKYSCRTDWLQMQSHSLPLLSRFCSHALSLSLSAAVFFLLPTVDLSSS